MMAKRFTDSEKWNDKWFRKLEPPHKLVFLYLCDRCTSGGFYELDYEMMAFQTGLEESTCKGAIKGLLRGLKVKDEVLWIKNFLYHQKNLPLNPNNPAHKPIVLDVDQHLDSFPEIPKEIGADLGLFSPIGNSKGKGKGKSKRKTVSKFIPPTIDDINEYLKTKDFTIDVEYFINHYASKGWMIGKNKMVDWHRAVCNAKNWEHNNKRLNDEKVRLITYRCPKCDYEIKDKTPNLYKICPNDSTHGRLQKYVA